MREYEDQRFTGERSLFRERDAQIKHVTFADGESPLKECANLEIADTYFQYKYPLWYCENVKVENSVFALMARAGIWYTNHISLKDCLYEAPKGIRRVDDLTLENVQFPNAEETLWQCSNVRMKDIVVQGDYFGMNCTDVEIGNLQLSGNYAFDGCKNLVLRGGKLLTKDAFWNCENVTVYDAYIFSEYLGWNSKNVTFVNCTIESLQGMCYMDNLKMVGCRVINTNLAFEYSTVDADILTTVDSVKNPSGGRIHAKGIGELIMDPDCIDPAATEIVCDEP